MKPETPTDVDKLVERLQAHVRYEYMPTEARLAMSVAATALLQLRSELAEARREISKLRRIMSTPTTGA